jgi:hypothetical protein
MVKVDREQFFDVLNAWGKDNSKKFVVIHHSIISEGISVSGLEAVILYASDGLYWNCTKRWTDCKIASR